MPSYSFPKQPQNFIFFMGSKEKRLTFSSCFILFSLLIITTESGSSNTADGAGSMESSELSALIEFMGALLADTNWKEMHPHPCSDTPWPGIQCELSQQDDSILHVTRVHVAADQGSPICKPGAFLSQSLTKLPNLKSLCLFGCFHTSRVSLNSSLFGNFSTLEQLVLRSNRALFGEIPSSLAQVSNLRVLSLSQNSLHGEIPREIVGLNKLEELDLSYNYLTGKIPDEIGKMKSLHLLELSFNSLTGQVPSSIGCLTQIQKIDFSYNKIVGRIPSDIGQLANLSLLDLSHNMFSGPFPETLVGLKGLEYFIADNNLINSALPYSLGSLDNLKVLCLSSCGLTGSIPKSLSSLQKLTSLSLDKNKLTGGVPSKFGDLLNLGHLNLSQNFLTGELIFPEKFVGRLGKRLDVRGNQGLCFSYGSSKGSSVHLEAPLCSDAATRSENSSWSHKSGAKPNIVRSGFSFIAADGAQNATTSLVGVQHAWLICFIIFHVLSNL